MFTSGERLLLPQMAHLPPTGVRFDSEWDGRRKRRRYHVFLGYPADQGVTRHKPLELRDPPLPAPDLVLFKPFAEVGFALTSQR